jgi:hypothetical protein
MEDDQLKLTALLHDAAEAYLGDISAPIKKALPLYQDMENAVLKVIMQRFGGTYPLPNKIHEMDMRLLLAEARELFPNTPLDQFTPFREGYTPLDIKIKPRSYTPARFIFSKELINIRHRLGDFECDVELS